MTILELQTALKSAGFDPGPLDGIAGSKTRAAIRAFQDKNGLEVDGIAGPKTQAKLLGKKGTAAGAVVGAGEIPPDLPWMAEAKRLIGVTETPGSANNSQILGWADQAGIGYSSDETAWCGLFVAHCVTATLPDEPLPANPLGARQWLKFGQAVPPQFGAALVFWRGSPQGWMGHVGWYWAEDELYYHVLGGNQSDAVSVARVPRTRLLEARWPKAVPPKGIRRMKADSTISVSQNEA
jgi:uncharacterized protein (TIGR02594 family)